MALLLSILLLLPCIPAVRADGDSGSCGNNLSWSFSGNTLTITGSGAMEDYSTDRPAPWSHLRSSIYYLSLPEGLTRIGNLAFYECENIGAVTLPNSVTEIGEMAFCKNRAMTMLALNQGLQIIGRSAFERCEKLQDLRIPGTVTAIGKHAFYMCSSLTYVTVPVSVTSMGSGVFAYCDKLARVDIEAFIEELPFWTFYGCDNLRVVNFHGNSLNAAILKTEDGYGNSALQNTQQSQTASGNTVESAGATANSDGSIKFSETTTTKTENTTISKTDSASTNDTAEDITVNTDITATVVNPEGWNEVIDRIQSSQDEADEDTKIDVNVYAPNNSVIPDDVLKDLAGTNINLTINTTNGSKFKIDCAELDAKKIKSDFDLSYSISLLETVPDGIKSTEVYQLIFNSSYNVNIEVMIRLPYGCERRAASLYQPGKQDEYNFLQSVVVDADGYAHYYLASINKDVQYLIAMDVQGEQSAQAIVPENLYDEYRLVDHSTGKEYVITGRKSSWNMGLGKVMAILAVVMISAIVVIGFIMYFWNKQRLKAGYVPQWDDEEELAE